MEHMYDGKEILEIVQFDAKDDYQPYQFMLEDGELVWIPVDSKDYPIELMEKNE